MASENSLLQSLDRYVDQLFAGWSISTSVLTFILVAYLVYPLLFAQEPDTHPFLLARQASASPIRQPGESAIYRSQETPHGYPLRAGLNVKDPGSPKWTSGRDGDLRDVWKKALEGTDGKVGKIYSVLGKETSEHSLESLTRDINAIGKHLQEHDAKRVAIYLPNSIEQLVAIFAAAFHGFTPILVPPKQNFEVLADILHSTQVDALIAPAGTVQVEHLAMSCPNLKHTVWVVEQSSRHMDFKVTPSNTQTAVEWHEITKQATPGAASSFPSADSTFTMPNVVTISLKADSRAHDATEYTQSSIVAAIAAQMSALPRNYRIAASDLLLPIDSLSSMYPLVVSLASLFSGASLALTPIAGVDADYDSAFIGLSPTIVVASAQTILSAVKDKAAAQIGNLSKIQFAFRTRALSAGRMSQANSIENKQGPRLIYISTAAGAESSFLTFKQLNDTRLLTGARTVYALTAASVAGAIAQTNILDYRLTEYPNSPSHFGSPMSSLEFKLVDTPTSKISDDRDPNGHLVVSGPAVVGGELNLGVMGRIREDNTLALA